VLVGFGTQIVLGSISAIVFFARGWTGNLWLLAEAFAALDAYFRVARRSYPPFGSMIFCYSIHMDGFWLQRKSEPKQKAHYVSSKGDLDGHEWRRFEEGKPIQGWKCRAWIKCTSPREDWPADDGLANHFSLLIFSERMRVALDDACIYGIQYLPIQVLKSDDTEYGGYSIANIINEISALDRDRSNSSVVSQDYPGRENHSRVWDARKPGLKEEALRVFDIIRVSDFPQAVYVSQKFVDVWNDHKLTGYSFRKMRLTR
jgi:hypothetical protein